MPKYVSKKVAEVHQVRKVETFGEKVASFLGGLFMVAIIIAVLVNL